MIQIRYETDTKKVTMRLPKLLLKAIQIYAITNDRTMANVINEASEQFLNKNMKQDLLRSLKEHESKDA